MAALPAADAVAPLSALAEASLAAEFGKTHSGKRLRSVVAKALVAYLAGRGESLTEIGLDVDNNDVEGWKRTWEGTMRGAGIAEDRDHQLFFD